MSVETLSLMNNDLFLSNVEALARSEDPTETWQVAEATKETYTSTTPGWTWDLKLNVWFFEGKIQHTTPPSTTKVIIKYNCCRKKGPVKTCEYEECETQ